MHLLSSGNSICKTLEADRSKAAGLGAIIQFSVPGRGLWEFCGGFKMCPRIS